MKAVRIGLRSRFRLLLMGLLYKPLMARLARASQARLIGVQARAAGRQPAECCGLALRYRIINAVPGQFLGDPAARGGVAVLYLHGGAFLFPASPRLQLRLLGRLCRDLGAVGFMPDYRLAPLHTAPAALDDCERAYRGLCELGFAPQRIVVIGESAGGNLVLGLLQRIRKAKLPMPACAVPISAVTDLARIHAPPSRVLNARHDALAPISMMVRVRELYVGGQDASDPEISPLYADYTGFPPLYFLASDREVFRDDTILAAERAQEAGVDCQLDVWPVLPHAFLLWESKFREARQARSDIVNFVRRHVGRDGEVSATPPVRAVGPYR